MRLKMMFSYQHVGSTKQVTSRLQILCVSSKTTGGGGMSRSRSTFHRQIHSTALCNSSIPFTLHSVQGGIVPFSSTPFYHSISNCNHHRSVTTTLTYSTRRLLTIKRRIPRKAALALTPKARKIFKELIAATESQGIMLKYEISSQHALRMAFKFDLIKDASNELSELDEGVSLEVLNDGVTPKSSTDSWNDNLPKLYIHHAAFMKVLGGTLDVDYDAETGQLTAKLTDREGHEMDPNA